MDTIAYTFATKCFKYLKIAYCLCFKRVDRRRNQRTYAENIQRAHTHAPVRNQPAAPDIPEFMYAHPYYTYAEDTLTVLFVIWAEFTWFMDEFDA